jgi:hypothetical protein
VPVARWTDRATVRAPVERPGSILQRHCRAHAKRFHRGSIAAIFPGNIETSAGFPASAWCTYRPEYRPSRPKIAQVESTPENRDLRKHIQYGGIYW